MPILQSLQHLYQVCTSGIIYQRNCHNLAKCRQRYRSIPSGFILLYLMPGCLPARNQHLHRCTDRNIDVNCSHNSMEQRTMTPCALVLFINVFIASRPNWCSPPARPRIVLAADHHPPGTLVSVATRVYSPDAPRFPSSRWVVGGDERHLKSNSVFSPPPWL